MKAVIEYADMEFDGTGFHGHAINGLSLMATLRALDAAQAASTDTHEGYSAWEVAMHLAYWKHAFAAAAIGEGGLKPYPYPEGAGGFYSPLETSEAAWSDILRYLESVHASAMGVVAGLTEARLAEPMAGWGMSHERGAIWLCNHDTYHLAQIRNMGVPGMKKTKLAIP